jgi:hypothetical protein
MPTLKASWNAPAPTPDVWLRIQVTHRRLRFATLLSQLAGRTLEEAWRAFRPLPGPDGPWGVPRRTSVHAPRASRASGNQSRGPGRGWTDWELLFPDEELGPESGIGPQQSVRGRR